MKSYSLPEIEECEGPASADGQPYCVSQHVNNIPHVAKNRGSGFDCFRSALATVLVYRETLSSTQGRTLFAPKTRGTIQMTQTGNHVEVNIWNEILVVHSES